MTNKTPSVATKTNASNLCSNCYRLKMSDTASLYSQFVALDKASADCQAIGYKGDYLDGVVLADL